MKKLFLVLACAGLFRADLSAQFQILPDSPWIHDSVVGSSVWLDLYNPQTSDNYNEMFDVWDPAISGSDSTWTFEGYLVYQLRDCAIPNADSLRDTSYARLVAQCDRVNGADTLIVHRFADNCAADTVVYGANSGTQYHYVFTTDAFTGQPLVTGQTYAYTAMAYAYNAFATDSGCAATSPFLRGSHLQLACVMLTGMRELSALQVTLSAYPSPAQETITVDLSAFSGDVSLVICDLSGRELQRSMVAGNTATLSTGSLQPGIYLLSVHDAAHWGTCRFTRK